MLIAIEGIDGAGKTHIAGLLAQALSERGHLARTLNKSDIGFGDSFADSRLQLLKQAIWPVDVEPKEDLLGTRFYLHLLSAWFAAMGQLLRKDPAGRRTIQIVDGSQYRVIAKAHRRAGIALDELAGYFSTAALPDLVVLLGIDPQLSWTRRATFKETELGRWDGHSGTAKEAYCAYQAGIQTVLFDMADAHGWLVVAQDATTRDTDVVAAILRHLRADGRRKSSLPSAAMTQAGSASRSPVSPAAT